MAASLPANISAEIDLEWLLRVIPRAEAELYRHVMGLVADSPTGAGRRVKMAELAGRTGLSKRWVIELVRRLEKKGFLQTEGGRGAAKRMRPLLPGGPLQGGSTANQSARQEAASPPPARPAESAPAAPAATVSPSPTTAPSNPAATVTPPPPTAPGNPVVPAAPAVVTPPPPTPPANPVSLGRSIAKLPEAPSPWINVPINDLVAYIHYEPVTEELIWELIRAAGSTHRLRLALEILGQHMRCYQDRGRLVAAIRSALSL